MKKVIWAAALLLAVARVSADDADLELLKKADSLASYYGTDFSAQYKFVQYKPGQANSTTVAAVFRRDSSEMYTIVIYEPAISRGQGYLKVGKTLWFYDPQSRRFNTTSSADRFQNTNARNSDFTRSTLAVDYKIVSGKDEKLGSYDCRMLDLEAVTTEVTYPRMKIWISKKDGLVRKTQDHSLSGQLLRTSAFSGYSRKDGHWVPEKILFIEELKGAEINGKFEHERTQVTISKASLKAVPDDTYSKAFLERVNK